LNEGGPSSQEEKIILRIEYEIFKPQVGVHFVLPNVNFPERVARIDFITLPFVDMYTYNQMNAVRNWLPCFDNLIDKIPFDIQVTVDDPMIAICPGDVISKVRHFHSNI
jgi:hypothetical protein